MTPTGAKPHALEGEVVDPVFWTQAVFRGVLTAMARPGKIVPLAPAVSPPSPLSVTAAAIVCTLADADTPVFLDARLAGDAVRAWIGFHTGATVTDEPAAARFAVIGDPFAMLPFAVFGQGSAEYPDRSTTIILQVDGFSGKHTLRLTGPGVDGTARIAPEPMPSDFTDQLRENRALFPRGVDLIFAAPGAVAALPRSVTLAMAGTG